MKVKFLAFSLIVLLATLLLGQANFASASKIPEWVRSIFAWYGEDKISEDELINAIKFLIQTNIIQLEQKEIQPSNQSGTTATTGVTTNSISVFTDKSSYTAEDTIVISGAVKAIMKGTPLSYQIFDPTKNQVQIGQIDVAQDGKYTTTVQRTVLWKQNGTYTVKVQYGPPNVVAEANFEFRSTGSQTTNIFEVNAGMAGTFDVGYTIRGGTVNDMILDYEGLALVISIDAASDGTITANIP
ncbi:MAG: hypothetical protein WD966_01040, partial [Nitrosopumilaceae archaeon]